MENSLAPAPLTVHLYCRIDVLVTDPRALTEQAVAELRSADIDWSTEEDDLESAAAELAGSVPMSLAAVADISRIIEAVPGVEFRAGTCRAEPHRPSTPADAC